MIHAVVPWITFAKKPIDLEGDIFEEKMLERQRKVEQENLVTLIDNKHLIVDPVAMLEERIQQIEHKVFDKKAAIAQEK